MIKTNQKGDVKTIENIGMLLQEIAYHETVYGQYVFRGESKEYSVQLLPSFGRHISLVKSPSIESIHTQEPIENFEPKPIENIEKKLLSHLKNKWTHYTNERSLHILEELALAQHHGFPTRLLDWTFNPMVALFFCVNKNEDSDGVFYLCTIDAIDFFDLAEKKASDPFQDEFYFEQDAFFIESTHISKRITAQRGLFSVQKNPEISFTETDFWKKAKYTQKFIIPHGRKEYIKQELALIGFDHHCLHQDIDSLCSTVFESCKIVHERYYGLPEKKSGKAKF